jgi:hypothetical protein
MLGQGAKRVNLYTRVSGIGGACGQDLTSGAQAAAVEEDNLSIGVFIEQIVYWRTAAEAAGYVSADRHAVLRTNCVTTYNGQTDRMSGSYPGNPPASCVAPASYFATRLVTNIGYGSTSSFYIDVQCGSFTLSIETIPNPDSSVTLYTTLGYFVPAVAVLNSVTRSSGS